MAFFEACERLSSLCSLSNGKPIPVGSDEHQAFTLNRKYTEQEIHQFELEWGITFPDSYRYFLKHVGSIRAFEDRFSLADFLGPDEIQDWMEKVYLNLPNPFPRLILTISFTKGEHAGFVPSKPTSENFGLFDPECPCEEWVDEAFFWTSFELWLPRYVGSNGEKQFMRD